MAEESKTYVFGQDNNAVYSMLASMCQNKGIDPSVLACMKNNSFNGEGGWLWVIFLFFLMGWGNYGGFGRNGGLANEINNDYGRDLLMQAINGNGTALSQLATTLNCDVNAIQSAINQVQSSISCVGNQVGMTGQQIINSIQAGNQSIASQLAQCCCNTQQSILKMGYDNQISTLNQTNQLGSKIDNQTNIINDKFCALEMRDMQAKINQLQEDKSTLQAHISNANQTAALQNYIASVVTPIANEVSTIKAQLPQTVTLPYSCATAVPTALAYQYGYNSQNLWF